MRTKLSEATWISADFLKVVGVTSQREIEMAVRAALVKGAISQGMPCSSLR